jgi:hypothetical protein
MVGAGCEYPKGDGLQMHDATANIEHAWLFDIFYRNQQIYLQIDLHDFANGRGRLRIPERRWPAAAPFSPQRAQIAAGSEE